MWDVKILTGTPEPLDAFSVREEVFVDEQGFSRELEFDDMDALSLHVVFYDGEKPIATGRLFKETDKPAWRHLGRIAVLMPYRGTGLGRKLIEALEDAAKNDGGETVVLGAQCTARGFYEKCGYEAFGDVYDDENCPHIYMKKVL